MNRAQIEHIIRAASAIAQDDELIIVGSQAILGQYPEAPAILLVSIEVDLYPKNFPDRADLIDGAIGEGSPFHEMYGYYAQGVGPGTALLPEQGSGKASETPQRPGFLPFLCTPPQPQPQPQP